MGLDVYVGGLARYFLREWSLEMEHFVSEGHLPEDMHAIEIKTGDRSFSPANWSEAIDGVNRWRRTLAKDFAKEEFLDWAEGQEAPWFTRKITWECYSALILWAAHEDNPGLPMPSIVPDDLEDSALYLSLADIKASRYPHLLDSTMVWLPVKDGRTFRALDPGGFKRDFGFIIPLAAELMDLNERTWVASEEEIGAWWDAGPPDHKSPLEDCAKFGFSVLRVLVGVAHTNNLPMLLDF